MADDAPEETEGTDAPEAEGAHEAEVDTDVSDLPLDESPEAHIRRALEETSGEGAEPAAPAEGAAESAAE